VANRNNGRRGRSRKRRRSSARAAVPASGADLTAAGTDSAAQQAAALPTRPPAGARVRPRGAAQRGAAKSAGLKDPQSLGERPEAPWHPVPVSELLILIGAVATVVGASKLSKDGSGGTPTLIAGIVAVLIGTIEFSFREHRSGYRSHTILLALLPTVALYTGSLLVLAAFVSPVPVGLKVAPLAVAVPLFAILFKLLRARFQDARRERVFAGGRR
jgi:hypothetical protein